MRRKLSHAQRQALQDVRRCGDPWARVRGQSQHGGWHSVMRVLVRNGWVRLVRSESGGWVLTDEGAAALDESGE